MSSENRYCNGSPKVLATKDADQIPFLVKPTPGAISVSADGRRVGLLWVKTLQLVHERDVDQETPSLEPEAPTEFKLFEPEEERGIVAVNVLKSTGEVQGQVAAVRMIGLRDTG